MLLINCDINIILKWCEKYVIVSTAVADQGAKFSIANKNFYVPVVILSTQNNAKLFQRLKSGFKRTINWNKYQSKVSIGKSNQYIIYLIDPSFQGVNKLFVL